MPELPPPPEPAPPLIERLRALTASRPPQALFAVAGLAGGLLAVAVIAGSFRTPPPPEISLPQAVAGEPAGATATPAMRTVAADRVVVHVAGAVVDPGVYRLSGTVRVADAIDEAGGPIADADVHQLNLAAPVRDGDRIYVPRRGEVMAAAPGAGDGAAAPTVVDLNRAAEPELEELPGVGPATARAIVSYREEHGPFTAVDQLLEVNGIGPAKLEQLRDLVRV